VGCRFRTQGCCTQRYDVNAAVKRWIKPDQLTIIEAGDFEKTANSGGK